MKRSSKESSAECDVTDVKSALDRIVGDKGTVLSEYGGFVVAVLNPSRFPWYKTLDILVGKSFEVWVDRKDSHLRIVAKQKID